MRRVITELERFSASFVDEAALRRSVIILLERMPGVRGVRDNHGRGEVGKDIIFETEGPFGQTVAHACVLKNHLITGSVDDDEGARTVCLQAEQALDTTVPRAVDGIPQQIADTWIISPYECTPDAITSIAGKLSANKGRLHFLCGRDLLRQFAQHYSEYLVFDAGYLARIAANFISQLESEDAVQEALRTSGITTLPRTLRATYVPPQLAKYLYTHSVLAALGETADTDHALTDAEVATIQHQLIFNGDFFRNASTRFEQIPDISEQARDLGQKIRSTWDEAFDRLMKKWREDYERAVNKKPPTDERPRQPVRVAEVIRLDTSTINRAKRLSKQFQKAARYLRNVVEIGNGYARKSAHDSWLSSSSLATYCSVENLHYASPGIIEREQTPSKILALDRNIIDMHGTNILIAGPPGMGKTSFCKWRVLQDYEQLRAHTSKTLSLYVPMYRLNTRDLCTFERAFLRDHQFADLWNSRRSNDLAFRLYLDGLDEVADVDIQEQFLQLALDAVRIEQRLSVVVTGRDYVSAPALRHFVRITVERFSAPQLENFIGNWFEADEKAKRRFTAELDKLPALREIMKVPLLGTLVLRVYQSTGSLPGSRVKLYGMFTELLAGGWDLAKKVNRGSAFGPIPKITVLANLADRLQEARRREFTAPDFAGAVREVLPAYKARAQEILSEVCRDGLIISEGQYFSFAHLSFQEYLSATHLTQPGGDKARRAIRRYLSGDEWWGEVVKFYLALSPTPHEARRFIDKAALNLKSKIQDAIVQPKVKDLLDNIAFTYPGSSSVETNKPIDTSRRQTRPKSRAGASTRPDRKIT